MSGRQANCERRAFSQTTFQADLTAHEPTEFTNDGEAKAGAFMFAGQDAVAV